jgi:hypothetical protein
MARRRKFDPAELDDPQELAERLEEEENEDAAILQDGQRVRVSLFMRDGTTINPNLTPSQRAKALHNQPLVTDGSSNPMAMHKPGFRYLSDARQRAINDGIKNEAYQEVEKAAANAWRNTGGMESNTGTGAPGRSASAPAPRDAADAKAAAYAAYDAEMAVAYLRGK